MECVSDAPPYLGMNKEHRKRIVNNINKLIDETDYKRLIVGCQNKGLISKPMRQKIEAVPPGPDEETEKRERHTRLFNKLTHRGPEAFQKLLDLLLELGFRGAYDVLERSENQTYISLRKDRNPPIVPPTPSIPRENNNARVNVLHDDTQLELQPYTKEICPKVRRTVIKSSKIMSTDSFLDVYPMKSQHNRGVLFVVNMIKFANDDEYRRGAEEDSASLLQLFQDFGFKLYAYENLGKDQFFYLLDALLKSDDVKNTECFVLAFMTHGCIKHKEEYVQFSDGSYEEVDKIKERFTNECQNLVGKPKILLFPFCRGEQVDLGCPVTEMDSIRQHPKTSKSEPRYLDIYICYATMWGYRSHRHVEDGSWYIQIFCEKMAQHAHNQHFEDIIKIIQDVASKKISEVGGMQSPTATNVCFNRLLYFNPGVYE